ncbi:hypothetical protein FDP41_009669 [Naegleria fowleri]|uniref:MADS-box domain-containing protein n=1 Tax=Naegleria fowleri TaxID=5763 RepID=A0A6A5AV03_NAEFO|nr:uncharacterized protein FDP41_009669 [Naegleria fowleri]KAF0971973.1 hypothetical protein FDP41_009669 [Naegleria fowleri]CAG4714933.1 unnamed protein product [Naegleria fowleri]
MGRKKIAIQPLTDERNRHVTFNKRKQGLVKKAMELSILCNCQISLVIFNSENQLFEYCSTDPRSILQRYCQVAHLPHERLTNAEYTKFDKSGNLATTTTGTTDTSSIDVTQASQDASSSTNNTTTTTTQTATTTTTGAAASTTNNGSSKSKSKSKTPKKRKSKKEKSESEDSDQETTTSTKNKSSSSSSTSKVHGALPVSSEQINAKAALVSQQQQPPLAIPPFAAYTQFTGQQVYADPITTTPQTALLNTFLSGGEFDPLTPRTAQAIDNISRNVLENQKKRNSPTTGSEKTQDEAESPSQKKRKTGLTIQVPNNKNVPLKRIESSLSESAQQLENGEGDFIAPASSSATNATSALPTSSSNPLSGVLPTPQTSGFPLETKTPLSSLLNSNFFDTSTTPTSLGVSWNDVPSPFTVLKENQAKMERSNKDKI